MKDPMLEDELLQGVMEAAALAGWMTHHIRRSDLGLQMGHGGFPDVVLVHPKRRQLLVLELKSADGAVEPLQAAWIEAWRSVGVDARVVRPMHYDALIDELAGDVLLARSGRRIRR